MSIRIACPSCHKVYNLSEAMQGKTVRCRECESAIPVPALADPESQDDGRRSTHERTASSTRPASAAGQARRNGEDRPRRRASERRSRRAGEESGGGTRVWLILLGVGAVSLVLLVLIVTGVVALRTLGKIRSSSPAPGASLEGDLAAMTGDWISSPVTTDDGKNTFTVKLSISPTAATEGRIQLELATRKVSNTPAAGSGYPFSLQQNGNERVLLTEADYKRRRAIIFVYRLEGDQLVVSGKVVAGSFSFILNNTALRRLSADPAAPIPDKPVSAQ